MNITNHAVDRYLKHYKPHADTMEARRDLVRFSREADKIVSRPKGKGVTKKSRKNGAYYWHSNAIILVGKVLKGRLVLVTVLPKRAVINFVGCKLEGGGRVV